MSKTALLVIDVQQGLCEGEGRAWESPAVINRINALAARARHSGVPVIFVQHESGCGYLERGTPAWQLAQGMRSTNSDHFIRKTTPDAFNKTDLPSLLERLAVHTLTVCGMHTEFCIDTTVRRALSLGFPVTLIADAHTSAGNSVLCAQQVIAHHNETLANITSFGPRVTPVAAENLQFHATAAH
jgi:nicotinamidase-related amidase